MNEKFKAFESKRMIYYICALLVGLMYGLGYTWAVVQGPFCQLVSPDDPDKVLATVALIYTTTVLFSTMSPTVLGGFTKRFNAKQLTIFGGTLFGIGYLLCGHVSNIPMLFLTFAVMTGLGTGLVYPTVMGYVATIFPDKGGTFTGIYSGIYGGSAMFWSPFIARLIAAKGVGTMSNLIGPACIVVLVACGIIMQIPPEGYVDYKKSQMAPQATAKKAATTVPDLNRAQMVKTPMFYIAMVTFICGLTSGMFVLNQASLVLQSAYGLTAVAAATFVSLNSVGSFLGRVVFGAVTDHTDKYITLMIIPIISVIGMGLLATTPTKPIAIICMFLVAFGYGGFGGTITPITADLFGTKYITENFGVMYLAFGLAGLIGPRICIKLRTVVSEGVYSYGKAFTVGACIALVSVIAAVIIRSKVKASQAA